MFGLALSHRLIQGPAIRGWNSITHFANLLWCKFNHSKNTIMPRSRRRYHSRSRSRSRSHSYDRDRELKRRRVDSGEHSPYRSGSPEDQLTEDVEIDVNHSEKVIIDTKHQEDVLDSSCPEKDVIGTDGLATSIIDSKQPEDVIDTKQLEVVEDRKQPEDVIHTKQPEDVIHTKQPEDIIDRKQSEDVIDTKQPEDVIDSKQSEDVVDRKQLEVVENTKQPEDVIDTKYPEKGVGHLMVDVIEVDDSEDEQTDGAGDIKLLNPGVQLDKTCKVVLIDCRKLAEEYKAKSDAYTQSVTENSISENCNLQSPVEWKKSTVSVTSKKRYSSPSYMKLQLERQKLREAKQVELELKKQKLLEEKLKIKNDKEKEREEKRKIKQEQEEQKLKEKQEKKELKQREMEEKQREKDEKKRKELEEREQKRKEKEEKDEMKRKEKEEKEEQKRKELEEKQKQDEKKQKVVAMFANFFTKKADSLPEEKKVEELNSTSFMPFKVKADMRVAPLCRRILTEAEKSHLTDMIQNDSSKLYLEELKGGKVIRKSDKTWSAEDDDLIIVENIGQSIDDGQQTQKLRAKLLKFHENHRPPYFGTWRQKSVIIKARNPLGIDKKYFNYEIDSDDEWEEEDPGGESLCGSDDDEKENEGDNDYELDNDVFVPHGYLSGDEVNDEEDIVESPEAHKMKLKLLKNKFEEEMKDQTQKIKPCVIGCIWEKKLDTIEDAIYEFLKPFAIICNGPVVVNKRHFDMNFQASGRKSGVPGKPLDPELVPIFLKFIHGSTNKLKSLIKEFLCDLSSKGIQTYVSKTSLKNETKKYAEWMRNPDEGPMYNKFCWYVNKDLQEKYNLGLSVSCV